MNFNPPFFNRRGNKLDTILFEIRQLRDDVRKSLRNEEKEMAAIDDLETKVAAEETVEQSAVTLLKALKTELDEALANGDTARIQALSDKIGADTDALATAVSANTPADNGGGTGGPTS